MPYIVNMHPVIRLDIMVLQTYMPKLVGTILNCGCRYEKEDWVELPNDQKYVILRDIRSEHGNQLGRLIDMLCDMENTIPDESGKPQKFYILLRPRKKVKKNVQKDREKAGPRGESGAGREPAGNSESEFVNGDRDRYLRDGGAHYDAVQPVPDIKTNEYRDQ